MSITLNAKVQRTANVDAAVRQFLMRNYVTVAQPAKAKGLRYFNITHRSKHKGKHDANGQWR